MSKSRTNDTPLRLDQPSKVAAATQESDQPMTAFFEPFVDANTIAAFISEPRKNVIRMAREGKLTSYPISGRKRHTYKFKRSEVASDLEKIRRVSSSLSNNNSKTNDSSRKK